MRQQMMQEMMRKNGPGMFMPGMPGGMPNIPGGIPGMPNMPGVMQGMLGMPNMSNMQGMFMPPKKDDDEKK